MTDNVRALNLSNCAAIMIYEVLRQQDYKGLLKEEPFKGADYLEKQKNKINILKNLLIYFLLNSIINLYKNKSKGELYV